LHLTGLLVLEEKVPQVKTPFQNYESAALHGDWIYSSTIHLTNLFRDIQVIFLRLLNLNQ